MMFRNQTRRGIRAVQAGRDPAGLCRAAGAVIPTYCNHNVVRMPPDVDPAMDRQRMRQTGRRLAEGYLKDPPLLAFKAISERVGGSDFAGKEGMSGFVAFLSHAAPCALKELRCADAPSRPGRNRQIQERSKSP